MDWEKLEVGVWFVASGGVCVCAGRAEWVRVG